MFCSEDIRLERLSLRVARTTGQGRPLVLLHGVTRRADDFWPVVPALTVAGPVWSVDLRGHGHSGRGNDYRVADYAGDVVELLRTRLPGQRAVLWGHSLGSLVALAAAADACQYVAGVILEDPPCDLWGDRLKHSPYRLMFQGYQRLLATGFDAAGWRRALAELPVTNPAVAIPVEAAEGNNAQSESTAERASRTVPLGSVRDAATLRYLATTLPQTDPAVIDALLADRWLSDEQFDHWLRAAECPLLLLHGQPRLGGMCTAADAQRIARTARDASCVSVAGVGHQLHSQAPAETLRLALAFLASLPA